MQKRVGQKPKNNSNNQKTGLFDHIKHIQYTQDPQYYSNLSEEGKKSFNLFMVLRGLSMNPDFIEYASYLYRFLTIIPLDKFYKILIELYPRHQYREFHPWIKSSKRKDGEEAQKYSKVIDLIVQKFEISRKEAGNYYKVFLSNKEGKEKLTNLIIGFGYSEKEVGKML